MNNETGIAIAVVAGIAILNQALGIIAAYWTWFLLAIILLIVGRVTYKRRRRAGSAGTVQAWSVRSRRRHGVASVLDIARVASFLSVRCEAKIMRPSMRDLTWTQRLQVPTTELGIPLCRVGALQVWASLRSVIIVFGAPGGGKTGWLGGRIIDAPGAVVSTSTRLDLWKLTSTLRAGNNRPVYVFNPGGLGKDFPSTITFNPLYGCETPMVAVDRATDMIPDAGGGDGERWDKKARRNLAVLLHAAAISGRSCSDVARWVADISGSDSEILGALRRSPDPSFLTAAKQLINLNDRTQSSITDAIMPAFSWLIDPNAVAAATGDCQLVIEDLLAERGTVYLLGREEGHTAPLLAALTGYIARSARRLAEEQGGRLDPPLTLVIDEAARVAPIPLPDWSGDFGGSGICVIAAFQSRADMFSRWGEHDTRRILGNSSTVLCFGGGNDDKEHEAWSERSGLRDEPVKVPGRVGKPDSTVRTAPVVSAAQIANMPLGRVLVFRQHLAPVIGTVEMAWRRQDVRQAQRLTVPSVAPVVAPAPEPVGHVADVVDIDRAKANSVA